MPDADNVGTPAPEAGAAGAENPLESAAGGAGGDENPLAAAAAAAASGSKGDEAPVIPDKFKNEDGSVNSDGLLKSYSELEKQFSSIERAPKTVEEYKVEYVDLPEGTEVNKEGELRFLKGAHERGMTNEQVNWVLNEHAADKVASAEVDSGKVECVKELKELWGEDYGKNSSIAFKAFNALATKQDLANPKSLGEVGNNPLMVRLLAAAGNNLGEDVLNANAVPGESQMDIDALMKSDAYRDGKHPDNAKAKERVNRYFKKKYPEAG